MAVFNVNSGNLLSARGYSTGVYQNYNARVRSMTISSGASPSAYVISDIKTSSTTCTG